MTSAPRMTKFWASQRAHLVPALEAMLADAEFARVFAVAQGFTVQSYRLGIDTDSARSVTQERMLPALVAEASRAAPTLLHAFGQRGLGDYLAGLVAAAATHGENADPAEALALLDEFAPGRLLHLAPDNPITILSADAELANVPTDDPRHLLALASYKRSLRPAGKVGRRRKEKRAKTGGRRGIDIAEAWAVRHMRQTAKTDKEIASRFWPLLDPTTSKVRSLIARRLEYAELHLPPEGAR